LVNERKNKVIKLTNNNIFLFIITSGNYKVIITFEQQKRKTKYIPLVFHKTKKHRLATFNSKW
ncbi:MAG: hypothetical protein J6A52_00110, partial [Bacilli bacterium]|nr:hypothetical protein [Bacilli bacterium]